jgi:hypothetical protein
MNANAFSKKDYDNVIAFKPEKTTQNKPNRLRGLVTDKLMRKPRSLIIKKLTINWTNANLTKRRVM